MYPDRHDTLRMMIGLRNLYKDTSFMMSMRRYSEFAQVAKPEDADVVTKPPQNNEFYAGTLLSLHAIIQVQPRHVRSRVLNRNFISDLTNDNPAKADVETDISDWLETWIGGEEYNWAEYLSTADEKYQQLATNFAERIYPNSDEDQLDFMAGFAFGTNMFQQASDVPTPPA